MFGSKSQSNWNRDNKYKLNDYYAPSPINDLNKKLQSNKESYKDPRLYNSNILNRQEITEYLDLRMYNSISNFNKNKNERERERASSRPSTATKNNERSDSYKSVNKYIIK